MRAATRWLHCSPAAGRRLSGVRLHSDTSGVTVSRGRPTGPGMVATALAGYLAPPLLGLGFAAMLALGRITALLWVSVGLLAAMVPLLRNAYGVAAVATTAAIIIVVSWLGSPQTQAAFAYFATWFLLCAGVRPVGELQRRRHRGRASASDADQLARLTGVPGLLWVALFGLVAMAALVVSVGWLAPPSELRSLLDRGIR